MTLMYNQEAFDNLMARVRQTYPRLTGEVANVIYKPYPNRAVEFQVKLSQNPPIPDSSGYTIYISYNPLSRHWVVSDYIPFPKEIPVDVENDSVLIGE